MATPTLFTEFDGDIVWDANLLSFSELLFRVFIAWDEDVTGLTVSGVSISGTVNTGSITTEISNIRGSKRLWVLDCAITNLPPSTDGDRNGTLTISISQNAVSQGNPATTFTVDYNYYRQDLTYPYTDNSRGDEFTELASSVGRYNSLSFHKGLLYGLRYNSTELHAFNPTNGNRISAQDITIPSGCSSAVFLNGAVYATRNGDLEKYIAKTSFTDYTEVANSLEYKESGDDDKDFLYVGKDGFYFANENQSGTAGTPGTPGISAFNVTVTSFDPYTQSFSEPISITVTAASPASSRGSISINGGSRIFLDAGSTRTFHGVTTFTIRRGSNTINVSSAGIPGTPGTPSTLDFTFNKQHVSFLEMFELQQRDSADKETGESLYTLGGFIQSPNYDSGSYDYEDIFLVGYDNAATYSKIGAYLALHDGDLTLIDGTFVKTVSEANTHPPAYAVDETYIYRASGDNLYRYEKSKLQKPNVPAEVYPILVSENSTVDLRRYIKNFTRIVFEEGYSPPSAITLSGHTLSIGTVTAETAYTVKLRAFNRRGATEKDAIALPIVVQKTATTPTWRADFTAVTIDAGGTFDVSAVVSDADSLSAVTLPTGASLSGFTLTMGSVGGSVTLRATKGSETADHTFTVDLPSAEITGRVTNQRYKIQIGGIDVSEDLDKRGLPTLQKTLDPIFINTYKQDVTHFSLKYRDGYWTSDASDNFWDDNGLTEDGHNVPVKISLLYTDSGNTAREALIFSGIIVDTAENIDANLMTFTVNDLTDTFRKKELSEDFGTLEKYVASRESEETFEGVYGVESSMGGIIGRSAMAWDGDGAELTLKDIQNASEGVLIDSSAIVSETDIRTQGGHLPSEPLLRYRLPYRRTSVGLLVRQIANSIGLYNARYAVADKTVENDFLQSRGNFQYKTLPTRITHIVRDWVRDATTGHIYALLSQADEAYKDRLIRYDPTTDSEVTVKVFDADLTCLKMVYHDSDFYIIATRGIETDFSGAESRSDSLEVVNTYDGNNGGSCKLIKYDPSADTVTDIVGTGATYPPQGGMHYHAGFENIYRVFGYEGIVPDSRGNFKVYNNNLHYRWAKDNEFGVARSNLTGSTVSALWEIDTDQNFEDLKFDFDIDGSGVVFIAYVEQSLTGSSLTVKKYESGSSADVLTDTKTFTQLEDTAPEIADAGGWYAGVHEARLDGDDLYLSVEIGRTDIYYVSNTKKWVRSSRKGAGAAIYKIDTSAGTPSLSLVQGYNFSQEGGRSLTPHDSEVFFVESPAEVYKFPVINPDFSDEGNVSLRGELKSADSSGSITRHGGLWYEGQAFRGLNTRLLSANNQLNMVMQYGVADEILRLESPASAVDNFQWVQRGKTLNFVLDRLSETGNPYDLLIELATKVNGFFSVTDNRVEVSERDVVRAALNGALTATATTLTYDSANLAVPDTGHVLIGNEIIGYTGKTTTTLTGLTRGVNSTAGSAHSDDAEMVFIDALLDPNYLSIDKNKDRDNLYNVIASADQLYSVRDDTSIDTYNEENEFSLSLGLSHHDVAWIDYALDEYLKQLKDLHQLITLTVRPAWHIQLGDVITYQDENSVIAMRVVSVTSTKMSTHIIGRTLRQ